MEGETSENRKRRCGAGRVSETKQIEPMIESYVRSMSLTGRSQSRTEVLSYCQQFELFALHFENKSNKAKLKWFDRFMKRAGLVGFVRTKSDTMDPVLEETHAGTFDTERVKNEIHEVVPSDTEGPVLEEASDVGLDAVHVKNAVHESVHNLSKHSASERSEIICCTQSPTIQSDQHAASKISSMFDGSSSIDRYRKRSKHVVCECEIESYRPDVQKLKLKVHQIDLQRLEPSQCLNDTLMTYYVATCVPKIPQLHVMDPQFFGWIEFNNRTRGSEYNAHLKFCSITERLQWIELRYVMFPVCSAGHWSLVIIQDPFERDGRTLCFHVDSLQGVHNSRTLLKTLMMYIANEKKRQQNEQHSMIHDIVSVPTQPQQTNSFDCALYVLHYISKINSCLMEDSTANLKNELKSICTGFSSSECDTFRSSFYNSVSEGHQNKVISL